MGADISPTPKSRVDMNVLSITEKRKLRQKRMTEWRVKMDNKIVCIVFAFFGGDAQSCGGGGVVVCSFGFFVFYRSSV